MDSRATSPASAAVDYVFQLAAASSPGSPNSAVFFAARASGLYCSRDGGRTWQPAYAALQPVDPLPTTSVALAPNFENDPTVFAGLNGAILCSHDGGRTWQRGRVPTPPPTVSALCISPDYAEDGTVFAGTTEDGVLSSQDDGASWVSWNFGLLDLNVLSLAISPEFGADETIFAGTSTGLFRSTNGGRAWRELSLPFAADAILSLAVSPAFGQDCTLLAGTENNGLLISTDRGRSWQLTADATREAPVNQILTSSQWHPKKVLILLGDAFCKSIDAGRTWKPWNPKWLGNTGITAALAVDAASRDLLVGLEDGRIIRG